MIKSHEIIELGQGLAVEVNYSKTSKPCKKFKFFDEETKKKYVVDRNILYQVLFMFADDEQQVELIPSKREEVREVKKMLTAKLGKDMKKGELVSIIHTEYHGIQPDGSDFHADKSITKAQARKKMKAIGVENKKISTKKKNMV